MTAKTYREAYLGYRRTGSKQRVSPRQAHFRQVSMRRLLKYLRESPVEMVARQTGGSRQFIQ